MKNQCLCCERGIPTQRPRICPICGHKFKGNGWDGIDGHWRSNHEGIMSYEQFWGSLCKDHGGALDIPETRNQYSDYIWKYNSEGSNKATSYIRALELLAPSLEASDSKFASCSNIWEIRSVQTVENLYEYVLKQQKLGRKGIFANAQSPSYHKSRFYSAALKSYINFLILYNYEQEMWGIYNDASLSSATLSEKLQEQDIESLDKLTPDPVIDFPDVEGEEKERIVKTRVNQKFFRKMILSSYETTCCVTGLNMPAVLRASHITPWAEDETNRMNPANGLCLSATYDAAFDRHLISFDEDYRMVLSPTLKEYHSNQSFKDTFKAFEGKAITLPTQHLPDQTLLETHRNKVPA